MRAWFVTFLVVALGLMLLAIPTRATADRAVGAPLPESLTLLGSLDLELYPAGVAVVSDILYVTNLNGFEVIDASNPLSMTRIHSITTRFRDRLDHIDIVSDRLVMRGSDSVQIYDIEDPTSPTLHVTIGYTELIGGPAGIELRDNRLYVTECALLRGCVWYFSIFDISIPGQVQLVRRLRAPSDANWRDGLALDESGNYALIAALDAVDVMDTRTLTPLAPITIPISRVASVVQKDGLLYVGGTDLQPQLGHVVNVKHLTDSYAMHLLDLTGWLYQAAEMLVSRQRTGARRGVRQITLYEPTSAGPVRPRLRFEPPQSPYDTIEQGVAIEGDRLYLLETDGTPRVSAYRFDRDRLTPPMRAPLHVGPGSRILP